MEERTWAEPFACGGKGLVRRSRLLLRRQCCRILHRLHDGPWSLGCGGRHWGVHSRFVVPGTPRTKDWERGRLPGDVVALPGGEDVGDWCCCGGGDGGGDVDCAARGRMPSCRNGRSGLDLGQCLRSHVAWIERMERGECGRILHPRTRHPSTVVVHRVVDERVSSTSSCDRTYHHVSTHRPNQKARGRVRLFTTVILTAVGTLPRVDSTMACE